MAPRQEKIKKSGFFVTIARVKLLVVKYSVAENISTLLFSECDIAARQSGEPTMSTIIIPLGEFTLSPL